MKTKWIKMQYVGSGEEPEKEYPPGGIEQYNELCKRLQFHIEWSEEDKVYLARVANVVPCSLVEKYKMLVTHGPSPDEALHELTDLILSICTSIEGGDISGGGGDNEDDDDDDDV